MTVRKAILQFKTEERFTQRDAEKLRGYFGTIYKEETLFHNHTPDGGVIYRMPLIQYKVIDGVLSIVGINEGVEVLGSTFLKVDKLQIGNREISHFETSFAVVNEEFAVTSSLYQYQFGSLWLPVNKGNYMNYINGKLDLNRVLQNHILTNFKSLRHQVTERIMVVGKFREHSVYVNNEEFFGFSGEFTANVVIPEYMSFGKNRATGFGSVIKGGRS